MSDVSRFWIFYLISLLLDFSPIFLIFQYSFLLPTAVLNKTQNTQDGASAAADDTRKCGTFKKFKTALSPIRPEKNLIFCCAVCCRNILLSKFMHSVLGIRYCEM